MRYKQTKKLTFDSTDNSMQIRGEGKLRAEGANYVVKDGDILLFKFK